ncbi:MAG: HEAT repeat domain-containing protein [Planctomycetota bacterium]|nr:HEAT repeat domain-containing protein [Planctomycetota bacterium]
MAFALIPLFLVALCSQDPAVGSDPLKDIKNKDPETRLAAVTALEARAVEDPKAAKALLAALKDHDWEVVEAVVAALGRVKPEDAARELADLAAEAPLRRLRAVAARALAGFADAKALDRLAAAAGSKKTGVAALRSLADCAAATETLTDLKAIEREAKDKDPEVRAAAAAAFLLAPADARMELFDAALADEDLRVACAALDALTRRPELDFFAALAVASERSGWNDVVSRRLVSALLAGSLLEDGQPLAQKLLQGNASVALSGSDSGPALRFVIWAGALGAAESATEETRSAAWRLLQKALAAGKPEVRAGAAHALKAWKNYEAAQPVLREMLATDVHPRARRAALDALAAAHEMKIEAVRASVMLALAKDADPTVREKAAVVLGVPELDGAAPALIAALKDADWSVAVCAAVSLGRVRGAEAATALTELTKHADWKMRGAAAVGLMHVYEKSALPPLIALLDDPHGTVSRTAYEILIRVARQRFERSAAAYKTWWEKNQDLVQLLTPEEAAKRGKEYGSSSESRASSFLDLDVVVFQSRGDAIETLLERIGIGHRRTEAGKVSSAELHPYAIYVSNCTGEIERGDLEPLRWYVLTGGYFFGSCWSLGHTIVPMYPGVLRMYPKHEEGTIMDRVQALACDPDSPYLEGVFPHETVPIYDLQGAHLIEVLQPERCEVLMDSPGCATRWGNGNLAAWFEVGHGMILDSANHFQEQGIANAQDLKKPEERMAYAFDHMALDYASWRENQDAKWWKNTRDTAQNVFDESAFRFITNFVRQKRLRDL